MSATIRDVVVVERRTRRERAAKGWVNWYFNRGRLPYAPSRKELRALSNRRVF